MDDEELIECEDCGVEMTEGDNDNCSLCGGDFCSFCLSGNHLCSACNEEVDEEE